MAVEEAPATGDRSEVAALVDAADALVQDELRSRAATTRLSHQPQGVGQDNAGDPLPAERNDREPAKPERWTQEEFDTKLTNEVAGDKHYEELKRRIVEGDLLAAQSARDKYGRNNLSKRYGVSQGLVSNSTVWQKVRDHLGLGRGVVPRGRPDKIGYAIGVEKASEVAGDPVADELDRDEVKRQLTEARDKGLIDNS